MNTTKRILLAALAGVLLILSFPYPDISWLAYAALIPLFLAVYEAGLGVSFLAGWLTGSVFLAGLCYWVGIYGILPLSLMAIGIGVIFGAAGSIISFVSATIGKLAPPRFVWLWRPPAVAVVWTALEVIRSETGVYSFPYSTLGLSQSGYSPAVALAAIFGVYGLSFLVVTVNAYLVEAIIAGIEKKSGRTFGAAGMAADFILFGLAAGTWTQRNAGSGEGASYKIAIVQASIPQNEKWLVSERAATMARYKRLVKEAAVGRPDLVVLPEAALPAYVYVDDPLYREVAGWARQTRTPILAGIPLLKGGSSYNTAVLFDAGGRSVASYAKTIPTLFGELVPFRLISERIYPMLSQIGDIRRGTKQTVFELEPAGKPPLKFGVLICSESLYSRLGRQLGVSGAEALVVMTNDAWFLDSSEAALHYNMSQFRAAETGFWVVQAANTGISGFVEPSGQSAAQTKMNEVRVIEKTVVSRPGGTFYARWGWLFPIALIVTCALMIPCFCLVNNCTSRK